MIKDFRLELEKIKTSLTEFMNAKGLWEDKHYAFAKQRPAAYFEAQQIIKEHKAARRRVEAIREKVACIEKENAKMLDHPETRVADVEGVPDLLASPKQL